MEKLPFVVAILSAAVFAQAGAQSDSGAAQRSGSGSEPYWYRSDSAPWYDSYGRLRHGYSDAPMKSYPSGKEPYYYSSNGIPWYDSQGRQRHGPSATDTKAYVPGTEPYFHQDDGIPWYDSYGNLRYGLKGVPAGEYRKGLGQ